VRKPRVQTTAGWIVKIAGQDIAFVRVSGLEGSRSVTSYNDGVSPEMSKMVGPITYGDVTLEKPYDVEADEVLLNMVREYCSDDDAGFVVTMTPVGLCNNSSRGKPMTLVGCVPMSFSLSDIDRGSDGIQMLSLVLAPKSIM